MRSLLETSKAFYQSIKTIAPEKWAETHSPYSSLKAEALVKRNLAGRFDSNSSLLNFIMVVPVKDWEIVLMQEAEKLGTVHHIGLEMKDEFFDNVEKWHQFRKDNITKIKIFFEESYIESDINILFLYLSEFYIDPQELNQLKLKNTVIINFSWDDRLHYVSHHAGQSVGVRGIAKNSDINFSMALAPLSRYSADSTPVFYWYGVESTNKPVTEIYEIEFEKLLFFGTSYGYRTEIVNHLIKKNLPIDLFGSGWGSEFIDYDELAYRIPRYSLCLGVSSIGYTRNLTCVKGRDFEVPSLGGLYLTNYSREIEHVYQPDEVLTYKSKEQCYTVASEVLENPSSYEKIKIKGQQKALKFSWESRFSYLKSFLEKILPI